MKSEYCELKEIFNTLNGMKDRLGYSESYAREALTYSNLESHLTMLKRYTQISKMKEYGELEKAVAVSRTPQPGFFGTDKFMKQARDMILSNIPVVISEIEKLHADKRTIKNENKEKIVQKIRSIIACEKELKDIVNEYGRPKDAESSEDMWIKHYKHVNEDFLAALNELKFIDRDLGCNDEFQAAMSALNIYSETDMIKRLMNARKTVDVLVGMIKTDYKISDEDIEKPEIVVDLENKISGLEEKVREMNKKLAEKPKEVTAEMTAIPKYKEELEELRKLQENLSSQMGMNEVVGRIKVTLNKIKPKVISIVLHESRQRMNLFEEAELDEADLDFLTDMRDTENKIKNIVDYTQFDKEGTKLLQQYSHEIVQFIKRKEPELVAKV
jgi:hypothetical protein